jgi:predicted nucleic-acid-binding protein
MMAVDTNILLRLLVHDDPDQQHRVREHIIKAHHAGGRLFVPQVVIQELIWVLRTGRHIPKEEVVKAVDGVLSIPVWEIENGARMAKALQIYEEHNVDFTDACLAAISHEKGVEGVLSFDRDMGRIGARWQRP